MKKKMILWAWILFHSCSAPTKYPEKKLNKDEMAEIIADLAIYNQSYIVDDKINLDETDRFVFPRKLRVLHLYTIKFR